MKQNRFDFLIFDLDGTLIDSKRDIALSVNHALEACGLEALSLETVSGFVGHGASNLIRSCLGEKHQEVFEKALKYFRRYYLEHLLDFTGLYPGVREILEFTGDIPKAVVTNKPLEHSLRILEGLGIRKFFCDILGGDSPRAKKPAPDALLHLVEKHAVPCPRTLMVGDSLIDLQAGKSAGIRTCAVTYGFVKKEDLIRAEPDYIIDTVLELRAILI
ncbi:MAG TPA: HAD-IA family hydrolase [Candidatus Omnitrophota bacterium]|nr:HAD-IA family hydrolase [Candidatus Omnitrophota bacterium]